MDDAQADPALLPARMLNEYTYCPRLAYLEWAQGEFAHSADTLDGAWKHRRVDEPVGALPETAPRAKSPGEDAVDNGDQDGATADANQRIHARSVHLSAADEGLTAIIDLVEGDAAGAGAVLPVDYKRGPVPDIPERAWEADRVQLCAQGLILRANGYRCESGVIYYAASRTRVGVPFDQELVGLTRRLAGECRAAMAREQLPPPLADSPKCPRCSLAGICLPDEVNALAHGADQEPAESLDAGPSSRVPLRRLIPASDDARPLYVQEQGAYVGKNGGRLEVRGLPESKGQSRPLLGEIRLGELAQLSLFGRVQVSTEALHALLDAGIPVAYFSTGGWFRGLTVGLPSKNVDLRRRQYAAAGDAAASLALARRFTTAKIENQRTLLRRNGAPDEITLGEMKAMGARASEAESVETLLGLEGNGARLYFQSFSTMLKPRSGDGGGEGLSFSFEKRNRRPPEDPVNALLSLAYAVLARDFTVACWTVGLDPFLGFYHQPRFGRPALALDLMEEFRPVLADSVVLTAINTGVVRPSDFIRRGSAVALKNEGRRRFMQGYERRMETQVTHPVFGYQISYRRVIEVQVRLLGRVLLGEIGEYPSFLVR